MEAEIEDVENLRADKGLIDSLGWEAMVWADYGNILSEADEWEVAAVDDAMAVKAMKKSTEMEFTYDNDATYFDSDKKSAAYSYKKTRQFSGLIGCIAELGIY